MNDGVHILEAGPHMPRMQYRQGDSKPLETTGTFLLHTPSRIHWYQ